MNDIKFNWDSKKALSNKRKHGISFEEAVSVFYDEDALEFDDPDHSGGEDRFIIMGLSFQVRVLVVCHCIRRAGSIIRIISARKATRHEFKRYWEEKR